MRDHQMQARQTGQQVSQLDQDSDVTEYRRNKVRTNQAVEQPVDGTNND